MVDIFCSTNEDEHEFTLGHYENSLRVSVVYNYILDNVKYRDLIKIPNEYPVNDIKDLILTSHCKTVINQFIPALESYCSICDEYTDKTTCQFCNKSEDLEWKITSDTYITGKSFIAVVNCIKILLSALDNVKLGLMYQYCLVRPPGHHCFNKGQGFCLINNVFVLSEYAVKNGFSRVLILDYDYHHADGTAKLVNKKLDRYLISLHAFGKGIFPGKGYYSENTQNVKNIPFIINDETPKSYYTDDVCIDVFKRKAIRRIETFNPELIIISNGLDGHKDDPLAGLNLTEKFYLYVTEYLKSLNIPLIYVLEGGYNPRVIRDVSISIIDKLLE